ncbi:MAG: MFS transporter [Treponema sp.]|nr:MFS transporter [Treponema sp.]
MKDSLFSTLIHLKGNTRACVYTEPLWGLSMNLCVPYLSIYMLALGLGESEIGFIAAISSISQILFSFLSGPITDKIGRRWATAVFDVLGWCIPAVIWWRAENFWFFLIAAIINGTNGVTANSWTCLLIEDAEKKQITRIFSLTIAFGQLSAVFAPITAILISRLTLIPAIRILFLNGLILMVVKVIILYFTSRETEIGKKRLKETEGKNIFQLSGGYGEVIKTILKSRGMVFSIIIAALGWIVGNVNNLYWQIIVSKKLLVPEAHLPFFNIFRSVLAIVFLFLIIPKLLKGILKLPLVFAFTSYFIGQSLLILIPVDISIKYPLILLSLVFDGFAVGALAMLGESLINIHLDPNERARILAIRFMFIMLVTAPFAWIGGILSEISRNLPFVLNLSILAIGIIITFIYYHKTNDHSAEHS